MSVNNLLDYSSKDLIGVLIFSLVLSGENNKS
jgi:hypothetical protein